MTWIKDFTLLIIIIGILFGAALGQYPLHVPDGARYAEIPREMVVSHDYVTPHLDGIKYFEKPPLFYWLQAAVIKNFGANDLAASLANAFFALASCLLVYFTSRKLFGRTSGFLASIILATSILYFALTRIVTLDMTLTFFITACLSGFILKRDSNWLWLSYACAALAVMTKGLVGVVLPGAIIFTWVILFNDWRNLKSYRIGSGLIVFLLIAVPWHILVQYKNPEFFHFYFIEQHFLRYLTDYASRSEGWWFFPAVLVGGFFPWIVFLPQAIYHHLPRSFSNWQQYRPTIFLLLWAIIIFAFYSVSDSKLIPYILPIFPPLAMLTGNYLAHHWQTNQHKPITFGFSLLFILSIVLGAAAIIAIFTLDFAKQSITPHDLYVTGACCILNGIVAMVVYRRKNVAAGFIALTITMSLLLFSVSPIITISNNSSIKPLAIALQKKLQPNDEVICYGNYYQDLPFYLQRLVIVAEYQGELAFGIAHQDTGQWVINKKTFWQDWNSKRKIYMLTSIDNYEKLRQEITTNKLWVIDKDRDQLLVTNQE